MVIGSSARTEHALCSQCQYDLDGLPPSTTRCPECGGDITAEALARAASRGKVVPRSVRLMFLTCPVWSGAVAVAVGGVSRSEGAAVLAFFAGPLLSAARVAWFSSGTPGKRSLLAAAVGAPVLMIGYGVVLFYLVVIAMAIAQVVLSIVFR